MAAPAIVEVGIGMSALLGHPLAEADGVRNLTAGVPYDAGVDLAQPSEQPPTQSEAVAGRIYR